MGPIGSGGRRCRVVDAQSFLSLMHKLLPGSQLETDLKTQIQRQIQAQRPSQITRQIQRQRQIKRQSFLSLMHKLLPGSQLETDVNTQIQRQIQAQRPRQIPRQIQRQRQAFLLQQFLTIMSSHKNITNQYILFAAPSLKLRPIRQCFCSSEKKRGT